MRLFGLKLNSLLVIAVAALLALGTISAFADSDPPDPPGDAVTVDDGDTDGDTDDEGEGHAFGRDHGQGKPDGVPPNDGDVGVLEEHGPGTGHASCSEATVGALARLVVLQGEGRSVDQAVEAVENCGMGAGPLASGDGDGGDSEDQPGNGNAFGRGHGQGKPAGVPTNDGDDE